MGDIVRLYISADIEGIVHVTSAAHTMPGASEYDSARRWMTNTVLTAAETAHAHGCDEIIVSDSHGNAQNILPDAMPDYVQLVRGWLRRLSTMEGIDHGTFDGAIFLGYLAGGMSVGGRSSRVLDQLLVALRCSKCQ
ncbi:M55 family metallopeptidase [Sphingosinicella microcystinivorans]|nr:M55 family metallopeptidase [Sphingosinicella microcystinivorans]RKS86343.1 D-aminopeptidase-like protein [Sphingosinicella microcystinivorans]